MRTHQFWGPHGIEVHPGSAYECSYCNPEPQPDDRDYRWDTKDQPLCLDFFRAECQHEEHRR